MTLNWLKAVFLLFDTLAEDYKPELPSIDRDTFIDVFVLTIIPIALIIIFVAFLVIGINSFSASVQLNELNRNTCLSKGYTGHVSAPEGVYCYRQVDGTDEVLYIKGTSE